MTTRTRKEYRLRISCARCKFQGTAVDGITTRIAAVIDVFITARVDSAIGVGSTVVNVFVTASVDSAISVRSAAIDVFIAISINNRTTGSAIVIEIAIIDDGIIGYATVLDAL